ncbi:MAG: T9SS type A sorting domain-containing protein, partial [Candidatus Marinimicrobia bacterium]|nr:T9SS type A sorting domain-containing protein [Candidatus Neomarinimicrobiota bacterium]
SFSNSTGYFKLTAVDNAPFPNESDPSNVFVFRRDQSNQGLLVINAYADQNGLSQHPFAGNVGLLADSHELGIETISDTLFTIEPFFEISNDYVPVILSGDRVKSWPNELIEILGNSTFWTVGPKALESISSSDAGYSFLNNTLGIAFTGTIPTPPEIVGLDHPFSNFSVDDILTDIGYDSLNVMDIPLENENTLAVLADTAGRILAMATLEPPTLMTGVPVEALPEESRIDYFDRSIQFLLGSTASIVYESNLIPYNPSISFYPNPFNSQGIIKINANPGTYHIYLFNISGATVWERKIQFSQSDRLSIRLPKFLSKRMSSGPYFILLKGQSAMFVSEKILYIK